MKKRSKKERVLDFQEKIPKRMVERERAQELILTGRRKISLSFSKGSEKKETDIFFDCALPSMRSGKGYFDYY